ncbi:MAG TPA: heterodisulfide reductase-related iron-sulfur binding cluster [Blastocatellia bacterium]|nr:heterodisulfide reductase-related iron-sulfur binding cluster [Blastocatellia bacterium]
MATTIEQTKEQSHLTSRLEANTERLLTCVHCGLCLPACPTYRALGNENDSPRGRVYLMRGVVEGKLNVAESFISHIDLCLGCRACESACPSSVPYGHLLEAARAEVSTAKARRGSLTERLVRFFLNSVFMRPALLRVAMRLTRLLRDSGLAELAFEAGLVTGRLQFALALLLATRPVDMKRAGRRRGAPRNKVGAMAKAERSADTPKVALLRGCVMEGLFGTTNRATERVLARNGCELVGVDEQMCCGALHSHAGQIESAKQLARANIDAFLASGCERVVVNAAGCGAAMKEYGALLADDAKYSEKARDFSRKVKDVTELLAERGIAKPENEVRRRVTYDAPCHLYHAQRVTQAPLDVLKAVPGLELVPLRGSDTCCGGAGIYNLQHPELSGEILADKLAAIHESGADTVATANPGCIMQIGAGARMNRMPVNVIHPVELLDAAYSD